MSKGEKMELARAIEFSEAIAAQLKPHCDRLDVAGSVRRRCPQVGDIEIVCIPKPYDVGLFESGIATVVERWEKVRGDLPKCKYTQRLLPYNKIKVDIFFANPDNYGLILAIRTGSADFSARLVSRLRQNGTPAEGGYLRNYKGEIVPTPNEREVFQLAGIGWIEPEKRT